MIDKLLEKIDKNCNNVDVEMVKKAYDFAEKAHKDQKGNRVNRILFIR